MSPSSSSNSSWSSSKRILVGSLSSRIVLLAFEPDPPELESDEVAAVEVDDDDEVDVDVEMMLVVMRPPRLLGVSIELAAR